MEKLERSGRLVGHAAAIAEGLGFALHDAATGGASDANTTAGMGVPTIDGLGPIGGLDHSPGEYLEVASIVPRTALLAGLITAIGRDPEVRALAGRAAGEGGERVTRRAARPAPVSRRHVSSGGPWEATAGYSRALAVGDACFVSGTTDAGPEGVSRHPGRRRRPGARGVRDHRGRARGGRLRARRRRPDADVHRRSGRRRRPSSRSTASCSATSGRRRRWWSSRDSSTRRLLVEIEADARKG